MKARVMVCRAIGRGLDRARQEPIADGRGTAGIRLGDHVDAVTNTLGRPFKIEAFGIKGSTTHGHRLIGDILHGSTIEQVRHRATIPLLVVRAAQKK